MTLIRSRSLRILLPLLVLGILPPPLPVSAQASGAAAVVRAFRTGGLEAARTTLLAATRDRPTAEVLDRAEFLRLTWDLVMEGDLAGAVDLHRLGTEIFPADWEAWFRLGRARLFTGDREGALAAFHEAQRCDPDQWEPGYHIQNVAAFLEDATGETRTVARFRFGEPTDLKGPLFGLPSPGTEPQPFAPGLVSCLGRFEFHITIAPDGREIYLSTRQYGTMVSRQGPEGWTAPQPAFPDGPLSGAFETHLTPDGRRLLFGLGPAIWMSERTAGGWGPPSRLFENAMYATESRDRTIYFTRLTERGGQIVASQWVDGRYLEPEPVGGGVASEYDTAHPCIDPEGRFLLFDSRRPGGVGDLDLWVSFRQPDGSWGPAVNLGPKVNSTGQNICASLSPDGRHLFYERHGDVWWAGIEYLEALRPPRR